MLGTFLSETRLGAARFRDRCLRPYDMKGTSMKQKLLVLLGAGSSLSQGMPKVSDIDRLMLQWCPRFIGLQQVDAASNPYPDVYTAVWNQLGSYLSTGCGPSLGLAPNFELALADMITLSNWARPAPFGSALQPSTSISLPAGTPGVPGSDYTASSHVVGQTIHLLKSLADHMRSLCAGLNSNSGAFQAYRSIFSALHEWFDVGVYNLNYDNVALKASPSAYVGFDESDRFDAGKVQARREWDLSIICTGAFITRFKVFLPIAKRRLARVAISSISSYQNHSRPSTPLSFGMCTRPMLSS
jgi:hypothetical protein